jgi:hypothetical protein
MNGEKYDFSFLDAWNPQEPALPSAAEKQKAGRFDFSFLDSWTPQRVGPERKPIELEKKPGLGFVVGETLKGTGQDIVQALKNLLKQSGQFMTHQVMGIPQPEEEAAKFYAPTPTEVKEVPKTPIRGALEVAKGLGGLGLEYAKFPLNVIKGFAKNPRKQVIEDPLGTLMVLSMAVGGLEKFIKPGKGLTPQSLTDAINEAGKEVGREVAPEFEIKPEDITQQLVDRYNTALGEFMKTKELPQAATPEPRFLATEKGTVIPAEMPERVSILARYKEAEGVKPGMEINIKQEADGSLTVRTAGQKEITPAAGAEYPYGFNAKGEKTVREIYGAMQNFKALTEDGWQIDYNPETRIARIVGKTEPMKGTVTQQGKVIWTPEVKPPIEPVKMIETPALQAEKPAGIAARLEVGKPVAPTVTQPKVRKAPVFTDPLLQTINEMGGIKPNPDYPTGELRKLVPPSLIRSKGMPMDELATELNSKGYNFLNDGELYDRLAGKKARKGEMTEEEWLATKEEKTQAEIEKAGEEGKVLYRRPSPPTERPPTAVKPIVAAPEREIKGEAPTPLRTPETKPEIEAPLAEKPKIEPARADEIERGIEDAILNRKEFTPEQKAYLEERQAYKKYEFEEKPPEVEEEIAPEVAAPRERLVKVTIKTPSGDFVQETMESSIPKIQNYARKLKVEDKIKVGEPYIGKWGDYLPSSEIDKLLQDVMRDVKTLSPDKWEKFAGYPFLPEVKRVFKDLKSKQTIKRLVTREEIKNELNKTPEGKVEWMYLETERQLKEKMKPTWKKALETAKRATIDTSGNLKTKLLKELGDEGRNAVIQHDLVAGTSAKAERLFERAEKEIYGGLSKEEEGLLNRAIQSRRTIAISKYKPEVKHPMGLTGEEHAAFLEKISAKIQGKADLYFAEMRKALDRLHDEGLLTEEAYKDLASKGDYSPRRFIQYIDPENTYIVGGRTITVPDSGIKALDEGSLRVMEIDSRNLLSNVISRTEGRIFRNNANKALYELADKIPGNGIAEKAEVYKVTKTGRPKYETAKGGYTKLKAVIDGQTKDMIMPDEFAKEWITRDPLVNQTMANIIGWLSMSKPLKAFATGINPGFGIGNMPRDIGHIWITTNEYSSFLPKYGAQMMHDLGTVAKDAITRGKRWQDYIDEGGGMNFLTYQGRPFHTSIKGIKGLQKVLGWVGETSEIWSRLALRERALRNGKSPTEATWTARNYLDFNQGGNVIKALDTGVPYLNASVQATRGLFRAVADRPAQTIWKLGQIGTLASGLYLANRLRNKKCWEAVPDREKINNFIITTPWSVKDKNGNERHFYFKIAKDQTQRIFCSIFENLMAKAIGEKVNGDQIAGAVSDFIPIVPEQNIPPTIDAFLGYMANKDFWKNEDIWKGPKVTPREEYTVYTDPAMKKLGQLTGLSPERTEYALSQIFTRGNIYTGLVNGGLNAILGDQSEVDKRKLTMEFITKAVPDIKRVFNITPPYSQTEIKQAKEVATEESTRKFKQERELNEMASQYYRKLYDEKTRDEKLLGEIRAFIRQQPAEDKDRMIRWFNNYGKVYDIPDRSWWLTIAGMPPETRATVFWNKYVESSEEKRQELLKLARKVPEIMSDRFKRRLNLLMSKWENENK